MVSGQKDEATDDDYYDDDDDATSEKVEVSPSNLPSSTTIDEGASDQIIDKINDATTIPTTPTVLLTVPTTTTTAAAPTTTPTIPEIGESVETTTIKIRPECPEECHCVKDEVECSHRNLLQIPKYLPLNTTSLNLSHNNLTTLNVSDLIDYNQLQQLILTDNEIETIIDTKVSDG